MKHKVRSLITKDIALISLPVLVRDRLLLSFVISEHTLPPPKVVRRLVSSYMKRFQCYSAQKSFMVVVVVGGDYIAIIATSSRSRSLRDLR